MIGIYSNRLCLIRSIVYVIKIKVHNIIRLSCLNHRSINVLNGKNYVKLCLKNFKYPHFYLAKNAVLSSFAQGKATALILDCGATHTTAVPVHEGMVLQKAIVQSPLGGDFILSQLKQLLDNNSHDIVPHYLIKSRETVSAL